MSKGKLEIICKALIMPQSKDKELDKIKLTAKFPATIAVLA